MIKPVTNTKMNNKKNEKIQTRKIAQKQHVISESEIFFTVFEKVFFFVSYKK